MIIDAETSYDAIQSQIPVVQFIDYWKGLFPFNDSFAAELHKTADACGYTNFLNTYMKFPPPGPLPSILPGTYSDGITATGDCDIWSSIFVEMFNVNPCFNIFHVRSPPRLGMSCSEFTNQTRSAQHVPSCGTS